MGCGGECLILVYADKNLFRCIETYEVSDIIVLYVTTPPQNVTARFTARHYTVRIRNGHLLRVCVPCERMLTSVYLFIAAKWTTPTIKMSEKVIVFRENYVRSERNNFFLDVWWAVVRLCPCLYVAYLLFYLILFLAVRLVAAAVDWLVMVKWIGAVLFELPIHWCAVMDTTYWTRIVSGNVFVVHYPWSRVTLPSRYVDNCIAASTIQSLAVRQLI